MKLNNIMVDGIINLLDGFVKEVKSITNNIGVEMYIAYIDTFINHLNKNMSISEKQLEDITEVSEAISNICDISLEDRLYNLLVVEYRL